MNNLNYEQTIVYQALSTKQEDDQSFNLYCAKDKDTGNHYIIQLNKLTIKKECLKTCLSLKKYLTLVNLTLKEQPCLRNYQYQFQIFCQLILQFIQLRNRVSKQQQCSEEFKLNSLNYIYFMNNNFELYIPEIISDFEFDFEILLKKLFKYIIQILKSFNLDYIFISLTKENASIQKIQEVIAPFIMEDNDLTPLIINEHSKYENKLNSYIDLKYQLLETLPELDQSQQSKKFEELSQHQLEQIDLNRIQIFLKKELHLQQQIKNNKTAGAINKYFQSLADQDQKQSYFTFKDACQFIDQILFSPLDMQSCRYNNQYFFEIKDHLSKLQQRKIRFSASQIQKLLRNQNSFSNQLNKYYSEIKSGEFKDKKQQQKPPIIYGNENENKARQQYIDKHPNYDIQIPELLVSKETPWVAAIPDGLIFENKQLQGCLEIKCPYSAKDVSLKELVKGKFYLTNDFHLKQNHEYYYQIQCQLFVTNTEWCDFVVYSAYEYLEVRILRNQQLINDMIKSATQIYFYIGIWSSIDFHNKMKYNFENQNTMKQIDVNIPYEIVQQLYKQKNINELYFQENILMKKCMASYQLFKHDNIY